MRSITAERKWLTPTELIPAMISAADLCSNTRVRASSSFIKTAKRWFRAPSTQTTEQSLPLRRQGMVRELL